MHVVIIFVYAIYGHTHMYILNILFLIIMCFYLRSNKLIIKYHIRKYPKYIPIC